MRSRLETLWLITCIQKYEDIYKKKNNFICKYCYLADYSWDKKEQILWDISSLADGLSFVVRFLFEQWNEMLDEFRREIKR